MRRGVPALVLASVVATALGWPPFGLADHIGISASTTARLAKRVATNSWLVEVGWTATCKGAGPGGASFQGNLYLVDLDTHERTYLGGVSTGVGRATQLVEARKRERHLRPELQVSCFDNDTLHGSGVVTVGDGQVTIPARFAAGGGGGGGGGNGGGGGGGGPSDPTAPLHPGGCVHVLLGTPAADAIVGTGRSEVVFALGGDDRVHGGGGHDCLLGDSGNDRLRGELGSDRLTGGQGRDLLVGGPGVNAYDAGRGNDFVRARNGRREQIRCGPGHDRAVVDRRDRLHGCERVSRGG